MRVLQSISRLANISTTQAYIDVNRAVKRRAIKVDITQNLAVVLRTIHFSCCAFVKPFGMASITASDVS